MKVRQTIENDIVENISIYKSIQSSFIELLREVKPDYQPSFTFNEFCVRFINNFEGVDDDMREFFDTPGKTLTTRLLHSMIRIGIEEFNGDEELVKRLIKSVENNK